MRVDELAPHGDESVEFLVNQDRNQMMPMTTMQRTRMTIPWKGGEIKRAD